MISSVREREIIQCADEVLKDNGFTALPIDPRKIAEAAGIALMPWKPHKLGISGFLTRAGENFGIGYSTAIENEGFINYTIAHELGHYFLAGHPEALFAGGNETHYSKSGFVSDDRFEKEADTFAAELLMPQTFFKEALRKSGSGFAAIQNLADLGRTSLVATGIRFARFADDPVAVVLSSGQQIEWSFISKELLDCRGVFRLGKGTFLPPNSATMKFNRDSGRIERCERLENSCSLRDWFEDSPAVEMQEDVIGLGHYGKTLTVLFTEEALDGGDEEEDEDAESGLPSSRWHRRDENRD
jgi:Zn-dependent peptidase ImmA (M78 family)